MQKRLIIKANKMVTMKKLKEFMKIILYTGYMKDENAVSVLIVGKPESGKSSLTNRLITNKGIVEVTDLSAYGISKMLIPLIEKDEEIKHIIIPDFLVVLAKSKATSDRTLVFINSFVEEGIANIGTYLNKGIEFKTSEKVKNKKVRGGIITSMTEQEYKKKKKKFNEIGFLSRFLVLRYKYSDGYLDTIFSNIMSNKYLERGEDKIILPEKKIDIIFDDKIIFQMMKDKARDKVEHGKVEGYGIRLARMFKIILKAIAYKNKRGKVTMDDWLEFLEYSHFINYSGYNIVTIDKN